MSKNRKKSRRGPSRTLEGIVKRHPDGFGFFVSDSAEDPDVYIPRQSMRGVMANDRVRIEMYPDPKSQGAKAGAERWRGDVEEILSRANKQVIGIFNSVGNDEGLLIDESSSWGENLQVLASDTAGAKSGQLVAVEIVQYPDGLSEDLQGRVIEILGDGEDPLNDVKRVIFSSNLPHEFSDRTMKEARIFGSEVKSGEFSKRKDLRELKCITIDGSTAKDFDDAIFVETTDQGFRLLVSIADVSHYVKTQTSLDDEAYDRGTSVYFPGTVVPMLPEELSNELCSLKPKVPRLTLTCEMNIDYSGDIASYKFYEAVICSAARVTYGQAQQVIDGDCPEEFTHVEEVIQKASDLAKLLMAKRFKEGALDLEIPETEVLIDDRGEVTDLVRANRLFAHRLIEELMLVANICAARFFADKEIPGIFRVHEAPDKDAIQLLEKYMHNFGGKKSLSGGSLQKKLSKALQGFAGKPEEQILNILTLRSMSQAKYSENNIGHFGLGFENYSHFTSPIRRYPDLIAHRQIKSALYSHYSPYKEEELTSSSTFLSACEQRSVKAERLLVSIKKARFMHQFLGEEFEGVVSGVAKFGLFVLLTKYDVDGRVAVEDLGDDKWIFDEETLNLVGKRSGQVYQIGDKLKVIVAAVDVNEGKIDFVLDSDDEREEIGTSEHGNANWKDHKKRRAAEKDRRGLRSSRVSKRRRKT